MSRQPNIEVLIDKANELAKEIGLTLFLDPSKINMQPYRNEYDLTDGRYREKSDIIDIFTQNTESTQDTIMTLIHEGIHQRTYKEIIPHCPFENRFSIARSLFGEALAYAPEYIFNNEKFKQRFKTYTECEKIHRVMYWPYPELSVAMAEACKAGTTMDEIFDKVKNYLAKPRNEMHDQNIVWQFIKEELGQDLDELKALKAKLISEA